MPFRRPVSLAWLLAAVTLVACDGPSPDAAAVESARAQARSAADLLQTRLKGELTEAMRTGGPVAAIAVCKNRAPMIAAEVERETSVDIERTALKVRNGSNAPDDWERASLVEFAARHAEGGDLALLETDIIETGALRWMRPIPMGEPCAACHGETIDAETRAALAAAYPDDAATGFATGVLRGAFTARVDLTRAARP